MKLKKVTSERLDKIQALSDGKIKFRRVDNVVVGIEFEGPLGPVFVEVGSYNVTVNELATKKIFKLGFFKQVADEKIFIEKKFDEERERESYIAQYLFDVDREELALSEEELAEI